MSERSTLVCRTHVDVDAGGITRYVDFDGDHSSVGDGHVGLG